jgi:hypothetical protein
MAADPNVAAGFDEGADGDVNTAARQDAGEGDARGGLGLGLEGGESERKGAQEEAYGEQHCEA